MNKHVPTDEQRATAKALATYGIPHADIASYIGISENTLEKWYKVELAEGRQDANMEVRKFLFNAASGRALTEKKGATFKDCLTAAFFWGKTQMGMRENKEPETNDDKERITKVEIVTREDKA